MVDARTLHGALGPKAPFSQWMKHRVADYGFEEGSDFFTKLLKTKGRPRKDYLITIDMAKELSMLERTAVGREIRRYYIDMEAAAQKMARLKMERGEHQEIPEEFFEATGRVRQCQLVSTIGHTEPPVGYI